MKLCLFCESFYFSTAQPGYSDMTPGCDAYMACLKGLVDIDLYEDTTESYRQKLLTARACPDYQPVAMVLAWEEQNGCSEKG